MSRATIEVMKCHNLHDLNTWVKAAGLNWELVRKTVPSTHHKEVLIFGPYCKLADALYEHYEARTEEDRCWCRGEINRRG